MIFTRKCVCLSGEHTLPALIKIAFLIEFLCSLEFIVDFYETLQFCYIQHGESVYGPRFSFHSTFFKIR